MTNTITYPTGISDKPSDRYLSPRRIMHLVGVVWLRGIDCDPFYEPGSHVQARHNIDSRNGGNAYVDPWPGLTAFANGPYSRRYPGATAKRCAEMRLAGMEVMNLCPAAPGSDYWRDFVWPHVTAVAWLGRLAFEAAVDMYDSDGRLVCKKGKASNGNRTEIALNYAGDDPELFRQVLSREAHVTVCA